MRIIFGSTKHIRFKPKKHAFKYPLFMLEVDVSCLNNLNKHVVTGYNRQRVLSIFDQDFLHLNRQSLVDNVRQLTDQFDYSDRIKKTVLITIPRLFFKTFRPVNFYMCYGEDDCLLGMIAEVTNTYKESYFYHIQSNGNGGRVVVDKAFHVSPFFDEKGSYAFKIIDDHQRFEVHIDYLIDQQRVFYANFVGQKKPFNGWQLGRLLSGYLFSAVLVFPRILYQAFVLSFIKKITHISKPLLTGNARLRSMSLSKQQQQVCDNLIAIADQCHFGCLDMVLLDKTVVSFGKCVDKPRLVLDVVHANFFNSLSSGKALWLEKSFKKQWVSSDFNGVIDFFKLNHDVFCNVYKR